jgi:opacity protein-like surface antigen
MKKLVAAVLILSFAASAASVDVSSDGLNNLKENYNNQSSEVPDFVGSIVGGERINFKLEVNGTNETVGVSFDGVEISNITTEGLEDPTMEAWTDQETLTAVLNSTEKYETLEQKLNENEIEYKSNTAGAGIKLTIISTLQDIVSFLGLEL